MNAAAPEGWIRNLAVNRSNRLPPVEDAIAVKVSHLDYKMEEHEFIFCVDWSDIAWYSVSS